MVRGAEPTSGTDGSETSTTAPRSPTRSSQAASGRAMSVRIATRMRSSTTAGDDPVRAARFVARHSYRVPGDIRLVGGFMMGFRARAFAGSRSIAKGLDPSPDHRQVNPGCCNGEYSVDHGSCPAGVVTGHRGPLQGPGVPGHHADDIRVDPRSGELRVARVPHPVTGQTFVDPERTQPVGRGCPSGASRAGTPTARSREDQSLGPQLSNTEVDDVQRERREGRKPSDVRPRLS